jgi:hypothetical protein
MYVFVELSLLQALNKVILEIKFNTGKTTS